MEKSPGELRFIQSKLQHLEIELIDIEEGLRFSQRGSTVVRQNYSRSLKIFYEIDEFLVSSLKPIIYSLLRKVVECINLGFCKAMDMLSHDKFYQQNSNRPCTDQDQMEYSKVFIVQQEKKIKMGGAALDLQKLRGIEQIQKVEAPLPVPDNLSLCWQDIKQQEEINSVVMQIRAFMNSHFSKSLTPNGSIQMRLLSILNYFNDCEKEAVSFLDNRTWTDNLNIELSFEAFLNRIEDKRESHQKLLVRLKAICQALSKVSRHDKTIVQREIPVVAQKSKGQPKLSFLQRTANKAVQTAQLLDVTLLEHFLSEKNQLLESQVKQNQVLVGQIYQYKNMLEDEKNLKDIYMSESQRFNSQLRRMKSVLEPLSVQKQEAQQKYSQLKHKVDNLCDMDVKDCVNDFTKEYSLEMQLSIVETINAILLRLGITKHDERNLKAQKKKHKFRVGIIKPFEGQNFQSEYLDELEEAKTELKSRAKSRAKTRKMQSPTDSAFDPLEPSQPQTPLPIRAEPAFEPIVKETKEVREPSESEKEDEQPLDVIKPLDRKSSEKQQSTRKNNSSFSKRSRQPKQSLMLTKPKRQNGKSTSVLSQFNNQKVHIRNSVNITNRLSKLTKVPEKNQNIRASHIGSYTGKIQKPKTSFATMSGVGQQSFFRGMSDCCEETQTDVLQNVSIGINTTHFNACSQKIQKPEQIHVKEEAILEERGVQTEATLVDGKSCKMSFQYRESPIFREANLIKSTKISTNNNLPGILGLKDRIITRINDQVKENISLVHTQHSQSPHLVNIPGIELIKQESRLNKTAEKKKNRHSQILEDSIRNLPTNKDITHRIHTQMDSPRSTMKRTKMRRFQSSESQGRSYVGVSNWLKQIKNIDQGSTGRKITEASQELSEQQILQLTEKLMKTKKQKAIKNQITQLAHSIDLPLYSNTIPIKKQIKQLKQAHKIQCRRELCEHLLRFYQNLNKIINRQAMRQPLSLKQFKISTIEHVDSINI